MQNNLNLSKLTQSATGQKGLKPAANGRYLMCKSLPYYFHLLYRSIFIVIHRTLTWTAGSLTCVRDHYCACVYTPGLGTPTAIQNNILDSQKLTFFSCAPEGIRASVIWILSPTLYQLSQPVTPEVVCHEEWEANTLILGRTIIVVLPWPDTRLAT